MWQFKYPLTIGFVADSHAPDAFWMVAGLSSDMYEDGITNITNIDVSKVVIEDMKKRCVAMEEMTCAALPLPFSRLSSRWYLWVRQPCTGAAH